jgi:hypothetical protein
MTRLINVIMMRYQNILNENHLSCDTRMEVRLSTTYGQPLLEFRRSVTIHFWVANSQ